MLSTFQTFQEQTHQQASENNYIIQINDVNQTSIRRVGGPYQQRPIASRIVSVVSAAVERVSPHRQII